MEYISKQGLPLKGFETNRLRVVLDILSSSSSRVGEVPYLRESVDQELLYHIGIPEGSDQSSCPAIFGALSGSLAQTSETLQQPSLRLTPEPLR